MAFPGIKLFDLHGRTALITGGSKGLGKVIASGLASAGANVVLVSRHGAEAQEAADEIAADHGQGALGIEADITVPAQIDAMIAIARESFGGIDILVNSAGINPRGPIEAITLEQFEELMQINVTGTWLCCKTVIPLMKKAGWGRIINLSSAIGLVGVPERTPYASSKGGILQLTRTLALEWAGSGITANCICPGPFATPINKILLDDPEEARAMQAKVPLGRWGDPSELATAVLYFASRASSFTTGAALIVDGGYTSQ